ncbi:MAG: DUF4093 domain-containing protein [Clostridia bacterium]|nr:DUF4093 domain-containing protein [Clostridia bacterium]MBR6005219.1 DUF4093 domain-containing protein [Clostridia bacterium]
MIKIDRVIIVEGKYDKNKLSRFIDAPIITTDGFGIFKDKERRKLLAKLAETKGLVVLTDSDSAGFLIRNFIGSAVDKKYIVNAYIPEISGKEKRKTKPSKEGILGVEGMTEEVITKALVDAGVLGEKCENHADDIKKIDLYSLGLSGGKDSAEKRKKLLAFYGLPSRIPVNQMVEILNCITTKKELENAVKSL